MSKHPQYRASVDVTVYDLAALRAFALKRALETGMSEKEFASGEDGESPEDSSDPEYWLGWVFDAGTPENAGFDINQSEVQWLGEF